jgi:hypothetical protein
MSQKVLVVKVNADGIRAQIYGKDYAWNKAKNQFFTDSNGKWVPTTPNTLHQTILRDRHSQWLHRQSQAAFIAARPNYQTSRERYQRAIGDNGSHRDYS